MERMMRYARIKPDQIDTFMHVYNRTVGSTGEFPFQAAEKEEFVRRIQLITQLYVIEPISYQVMGNTFISSYIFRLSPLPT
jgi:hypothetical protein